ncbi:MAG: NGG1p interacting factor NIF3 [Patescibacteria group bacterium]|nr:NGG1p interacting factor NIF3 [Patescibacteria group bacterium]
MLTIQQIFELGLKMAVTADPRGERGVKKYLARAKDEYDNMKPEDKKFFDSENLKNPYSDSRVHLGDLKKPVKRVLAGIDIGSAEILLASQLGERGKPIDLVIAHHPIGKSLADLHGVMDMAVEVYENFGVPVHVAEKLMEERIKEVGRGVHPSNHFQIIDIARLLKVDLMNTHTFADNLVSKFVSDFIIKQKPETIGDLIKTLTKIPEYAEGRHRGAGPKIFAGSPKHRVGKFMMEMTGGTNPSNEVYQELSRAGVSTVVGMHMKDEATKKANEFHMNVVIAGHISSDSLGMNLFLDELEKRGVEVITCGGLIRVNRRKKRK